LLSVALAFSWQYAVVHTAFHGNWTALFCAGDRFRRPPEIQQREYVFQGSTGYDGQFYQLIAHDPIFQHHYDGFVDAPRLRYRRILMPGLANLVAAGRAAWIDPAYIAVCWFFTGLGTFCLSQLAIDAGRPALWGLLFLITPATLMAIERMTVDIALTALCLACLVAARRRRWLLLWFTLAGAMLSKETGVLAIAAVVVWLARQRNFRLAAALGSSLLPAIVWYAFVQTHTGGDYHPSSLKWGSPFFAVLKLPLEPGMVALLFRIATIVAVAGMLWAAIRSLVLAVRRRCRDLEVLLCLLFAALVLLLQEDRVWADPDGFTRVYSPLLVCLIAATWRKGFSQTLTGFAMVACPLCLQLGGHLVWPVLRTGV
jgi:hypothetical protein